MKHRLSSWHYLAIILLLPFLAYGTMVWYEDSFQRLPVYGREGKKIAHSIGQFRLMNQDSSIIGSDAWRGKVVVANFFFTHCAGVCPKMTSNLKRVQNAYRNNDHVLITSFTVDPERDGIGQLKSYAERLNINTTNWNLLTGSKKDIYKLARNEFMVVATDGDGGAEDFIHSEKLILIDQHKMIRGYYDGTNSKDVTQLIHDIKKLEDE